MLIIFSLVLFIVASQDILIEVTYNDQTFRIPNGELTMNKLKTIFNISEFKYLEDLSGVLFYPTPEGSFPSPISSQVYVRQILSKQIPTVIYPTESKFVFNTGNWLPAHTMMEIGFSNLPGDTKFHRGFIQFKDVSLINKKKKISKVYLRMVGVGCRSQLPVQIFVHKCESDWQGIISWNQQPIYSNRHYSSIVVSEVSENSFYWDVTEIFIDWTTGLVPNYGIALKTNDSTASHTRKDFHNTDPLKKPVLLVYYSD